MTGIVYDWFDESEEVVSHVFIIAYYNNLHLSNLSFFFLFSILMRNVDDILFEYLRQTSLYRVYCVFENSIGSCYIITYY